MFPFSKSKAEPTAKATGNQLLKRFIALGAGMLLLWLALSIMPKQPDAAEPSLVFSSDEGTVTSSPNIVSESSNSNFDLGKITAGLLLLGLVVFAYIWQKKSTGRKLPSDTLNVLGKIQLGPNQQIHLVGCGKDALLLGSTNSQITLIHQLPLQTLHPPSHPQPDTNTTEVTTAPQYSTSSSTMINNPDFGIMLQQQNFSTDSLSGEKLAASVIANGSN